jgi:hypothetical protein
MACGEHPLRALTSSKRIRERKSSLGNVTHRLTFRFSGMPVVKQKQGVTAFIHELQRGLIRHYRKSNTKQ